MDNNLFFHKELNHQELSDKQLYRLLKNNEICWAGNRRLKIYGTLSCASGKRMKKENRVFFLHPDAPEALGVSTVWSLPTSFISVI